MWKKKEEGCNAPVNSNGPGQYEQADLDQYILLLGNFLRNHSILTNKKMNNDVMAFLGHKEH